MDKRIKKNALFGFFLYMFRHSSDVFDVTSLAEYKFIYRKKNYNNDDNNTMTISNELHKNFQVNVFDLRV